MKKIFSLFMVFLMVFSIGALAITDAETIKLGDSPDSGIREYTGTLNKQNADETVAEEFIRKISEGQAFAFVSDSDVETRTAEGTSCVGQRRSRTYELRRGGLSSENKILRAGAQCHTGEYIVYHAQIGRIEYSPVLQGRREILQIFNKMWYKSNDNDILRYADEGYSREGLFDDFGVNRVEAWYECFVCEAPEIKGCTDSSATNYNQEANTNDGSCEFAIGCEDFGTYIIDDGDRFEDQCTAQDVAIKHTCVNDQRKSSTVDCTSDQECINAECIDLPQEETIPSETPQSNEVGGGEFLACTDDVVSECPDGTLYIVQSCENNQLSGIIDFDCPSIVSLPTVREGTTQQTTLQQLFDVEEGFGAVTYGLILAAIVLAVLFFMNRKRKK